MSLQQAIERHLYRNAPSFEPPFPADATARALSAWRRHHRLVATSGMLRGMAQPFLRTAPPSEPGLPSVALRRDWEAALSVEARRAPVDRARSSALLTVGEDMLARMRSFEVSDAERMRAIGSKGARLGFCLSIVSLALVAALTMTKGETWGVAACLAWFAMAAGAAIVHEVVVMPGLAGPARAVPAT